MFRPLIFVLALTVAGCDATVQTTSGRDYVAAAGGQIDPTIAAIASVEPNLHFPARIGVARIVNDRLTLPTAPEIALFEQAIAGRTYGTFVPVNPQISDLLRNVPVPTQLNGRPQYVTDVNQLVRMTAARQHLDYVLIYKVGARGARVRSPFGLDDIRGTTIATPDADVTGIVQAVFLDVRNGYPYAALQVDTDLSRVQTNYRLRNRTDMAQQAAIVALTVEVMPQVQQMLADLAAEAR